jgi:hypothetical protein
MMVVVVWVVLGVKLFLAVRVRLESRLVSEWVGWVDSGGGGGGDHFGTADREQPCSRGRDVFGDHHKMPESFNEFWRMVSFTAANTRRIFEVSVACVRLSEC